MDDVVTSLQLTTGPQVFAVSLAQLKQQVRLDPDLVDEDLLLEHYLLAASEAVQIETGRALIQTTYTYRLSEFPTGDEPIALPYPPLASVTSVAYVDGDGDTVTWINVVDDPLTIGVDETVNYFRVDTASTPGVIYPLQDAVWPATQETRQAVTIVYVAGFANADSIPAGLKQMVLLLAADMYVNREATGERMQHIMPYGYDRLRWHHVTADTLVG